jgi:citrate lyase beta subunit
MSETMRGIVEDDRARRLGAALTALRWTSGDLAEVLGIGVSTARRWREGLYPVPDAVMTWIEGLVSAVEAMGPPPTRVKRGYRPLGESDEWAEWG